MVKKKKDYSKFKKQTKRVVWPVRVTVDLLEKVERLTKDEYNIAEIARQAWSDTYDKIYGKNS